MRAGFRRWAASRRAVLLIAAVVVLVHVLSPSPQTGDSRLSVVVAWNLVTSGTLDLSGIPAVEALAWKGDLIRVTDGRLVPFFPWPPMLLALPGTLVLRAAGIDPAALSISDPNLTWIVEVPTASILVAVTAVLLRRIVLDAGHDWSTPRVATLTALAFAFTTIAWSTGSRALWQQTVSMLVLTALVLAVQRTGRGHAWHWAVGILCALAFAVRPTNAVVIVLVLIWLVVRARPALPRATAGAAIVALVFLAASWQLTGSPLPDYYLPARLASDPVYGFGESLAVHLVSPARGLIVYVPLFVVAVVVTTARIARRRFDGLMLVLAGSVVLQLLVVVRFGSTNGFTYGPRLLMDVVPFIVLLAAPAFVVFERGTLPDPGRRVAIGAVAVVLTLGLLVNATGALSRQAVCWNASPQTIDDAPERVWSWRDPPFLRPWRALAAGEPVFVGSCATALSPPRGATAAR